jgi:hypothetical protein
MPKNRFNYKISSDMVYMELDTQVLFDGSYCEPRGLSPLTTFFQKTALLNSLWQVEMPEQLPNLLVLGYVSAVESYLREIIRKLVIIDIPSQKKCEDKNITYGAATTYEKTMLPDALLEECSFADKKNIVDSLKNFLGINFQKSEEPDLDKILEDFSKVCQIRHCIVHRFGHLGSKNAMEFGLSQHKECLGKPVKLDFKTLQIIFLICNNTVKLLNNFLFIKILTRTTEKKYEKDYNWSWNFKNDRSTFKKYYDLFSTDDPQTTIKDAYEAFRKACSGISGSE